ncbi:hypothetical protein Dsin_001260 [Dipteronia sinensis]|uniref:HAT C-terminal dimerisation domain-containing protein n=1 Tax=Dipteronia sinensis TaxID=43782 RepID=A0AAE0B518_9ROSI|nr:hypothetical protein Dsin_001260 [Dipteronia sinensis]
MRDVKGFESYKRKYGRQHKLTSELESYLEQEVISGSENFDILLWWKMQKGRYPILSKIARDVLVIPVSTVASESAFSISGRTLSSHHSRLHPHTVEALMHPKLDMGSKTRDPKCSFHETIVLLHNGAHPEKTDASSAPQIILYLNSASTSEIFTAQTVV